MFAYQSYSSIMMKNAILFMLLYAVCFSLNGQGSSDKFDVKWGQPIKINKRFIFEDIITIDDNRNTHVLYAERNRLFPSGVKYHTFKISGSLKLTERKELRHNIDGQTIDLNNIIETGRNQYFFITATDNKAKMKSLYLLNYEPASMTLSSGNLLSRFSYDGFKKSKGGEFRVSYSADRNFILVYYGLPYGENDPERFGVIVFDKDMNEKWKNEYTLKYTSDRFSVEEVFVANNGEMNILGKRYTDKSSFLKRDPRFFHYVLFSTVKAGSEISENEISLQDYYIADMAADVNNAGKIICSGFITEKARSLSVKGVFYFTIDQNTGQIETRTVKEFDIDVLSYGKSQRKQDKTEEKISKGKNVEMPYYQFRNFILKENGGVLLTAEEHYVRVVSTTDARTGITTYTHYYHYNNIIVIDVNPDGSINWITIVPKYQYSKEDFGFYSSFLLATRGDKVYLVYNDHVENLKNTTPKQKLTNTRNPKKKYVAIITVDNKGKWIKEMLFPLTAKGQIFMPKNSLQMSDDEVLLYCCNAKADKFGIARLK